MLPSPSPAQDLLGNAAEDGGLSLLVDKEKNLPSLGGSLCLCMACVPKTYMAIT